jgi:hypothetical protein
VTTLGILPAMVGLAMAVPRLVAVPAAPTSGCPNATQVAEALRTRLPDATVPAQPLFWPSEREVLRSVLEIAPDATLVRFSLVDSRGEVQLRRSLPTAVHGDTDDCVALAEALAAIVERFLDFRDYDVQADAGLGASSGPSALPPVVAMTKARPAAPGRSWQLFIGGGVQTGDAGTYDGHLGAAIDLGVLRAPVSLTASVGIARGQQATRTAGSARLDRIPFRLGAAASFQAGPGILEPTVELGADWAHGQVMAMNGPDTLTTTDAMLLTNWTVNGAFGYRVPIGSLLFLRIRGGAGLALSRYALAVKGSPDLLSTPRTYLDAALETGVVFR